MSTEDKDRYFLLEISLKRIIRDKHMVWLAVARRMGVEIASATAYWPADAVNGCLLDVDNWLKKNAAADAAGTRSFDTKPRKRGRNGSKETTRG